MNELIQLPDLSVETEVVVRKFDADGNCNYEWTGKNLVKDVVGVIAKQWWKSLYSAWVPNFASSLCRPATPYYEVTRYAYLVNTTATPDATKDNVFPAATIVGYCNKSNQTVGADPTIGILNSTESYQLGNSLNNKVKLKYEWGLSKANGTFNSLVHARLDSTNIGSQVDCRVTDTTLTFNDRPWDYTEAFAVNIANNGDRVVYYDFSLADDGLGTKKLVMKRKNMTTGVEMAVLDFTEWKSKYGTIIPNMVAMTSIGSRLVFTFAHSGSQVAVVYIIDGSNHWIVTTDIDGRYTVSIDQQYSYIRPVYATAFYRFDHTTVSANATVSLTEWVVTDSTYTYVVGNKAYRFDQLTHYDLTGANWSTHSTITGTQHSYTYPNLGQYPVIDNAGNCYYRRYNTQYSTLQSSGETNEYAIHYAPFLQPRQVETTHIKFPTITKTITETLQIDYTFTFA